jgi:hypothetical protein
MPEGIALHAADDAGVHYGNMTLRQLIRVCPDAVPCGTIEDSPDIPVRGVMLDISRDKVPTMETLFMLMDMFSEWKINHLQLYMEHTFAYRNHRDVWAAADPLTAEEIRTLDAYCRDRFIELAPNQNSFGHMARWLKHDRYRHLAECPDGWAKPNGIRREGPWSLDPTNPGSLELLQELYGELLPNFSSPNFNVGCDEAWDVGQGKSRVACESRGRDTVFLEFLSSVCDLVRSFDRVPMYWGDMVWLHKPEPSIALDRLDREAVMIDWGYIRDYPFDAHGEALANAGLPFWFAPGTGAWGTLVGCNESGFGSNRSAARAGLAHGASGFLNTDWGDGGHWQQLPVSFSGFAAGAAMSWCEETNTDQAIREALSPHVFLDEAGVMGDLAWDLAETWQLVSENATQAGMLHQVLADGTAHKPQDSVTGETLRATVDHLEAASRRLSDPRMQRSDAGLIVSEFENGIRMALHAARLDLAIRAERTDDATLRHVLAEDMREIIETRRQIWCVRNRAGGLADSLKILKVRAAEYTDMVA